MEPANEPSLALHDHQHWDCTPPVNHSETPVQPAPLPTNWTDDSVVVKTNNSRRRRTSHERSTETEPPWHNKQPTVYTQPNQPQQATTTTKQQQRTKKTEQEEEEQEVAESKQQPVGELSGWTSGYGVVKLVVKIQWTCPVDFPILSHCTLL